MTPAEVVRETRAILGVEEEKKSADEASSSGRQDPETSPTEVKIYDADHAFRVLAE